MVPGAVAFTDLSTGNPTSWSWDFGDGSVSSQKNPPHMYTVAGTYTVSLTVRNGYGMDKKTKAAFINAGSKPVADFTADETGRHRTLHGDVHRPLDREPHQLVLGLRRRHDLHRAEPEPCVQERGCL